MEQRRVISIDVTASYYERRYLYFDIKQTMKLIVYTRCRLRQEIVGVVYYYAYCLILFVQMELKRIYVLEPILALFEQKAV